MTSLRRFARPGLPLSIAAALLVVSPALARAAVPPWLPLEVGNRWQYVSAGGGGYAETITGTLDLLGRTVFVKSYAGGPDDGLENYWMTDAGGSVFLAGFNNRPANFAWGYDPPLELLAAPPSLGLVWSARAVIVDLSNLLPVDSIRVSFGVLEDVMLTVPAGDFHAFGVGQGVVSAASRSTLASASGQRFTLDGRRLPATAGPALAVPTDWYAQGVGVVQKNSSAFYQLQRFWNITPVAQTSWGRVKRLYH